MNLKNATVHSQNILHADTLHNTEKRYIKRYVQNWHSPKFPVIFFMKFAIFALFAMQLDYCNIQREHDQRYELPLFTYS